MKASITSWKKGRKKKKKKKSRYGGCKSRQDQKSYPPYGHYFICDHTPDWVETFIEKVFEKMLGKF